MAIDYGDVRTGVAICDKMQLLASPYCVITERNKIKLIERICAIIKDEDVAGIVVGLPRNMDGSYGFRCRECRSFGSELQEAAGLPVCFQDERLTTVIANDMLTRGNVSGKKRKQNVDALSAVLILESYLKMNK